MKLKKRLEPVEFWQVQIKSPKLEHFEFCQWAIIQAVRLKKDVIVTTVFISGDINLMVCKHAQFGLSKMELNTATNVQKMAPK